LHTLAKLVAKYVIEGQRDLHAHMKPQSASPLGPRIHIALARRLVAAGDPSAAIVGRSFLVAPEAIAAELAAISRRAKGKAPQVRDELTRLRTKYPLKRAS